MVGNQRAETGMVRPKDSIGQLLNPCTSYREKLKSRGIQPKDYAKENRRKLKQLEARNRALEALQEAEAQKAAKPFAAPAKYKDVQKCAKMCTHVKSKHLKHVQFRAKKHDFLPQIIISNCSPS